MTMHSNKKRSLPDRRGGASNQPKPRRCEHHTHWMEQYGNDPRYWHCILWGCQYAEVDGKPTHGGQKERTREYVFIEPGELFSQEDMDAARFSRHNQMAWEQ